LYRPYLFASQFKQLIPVKELLEPELFFEDRHGTRWRRVDAREVQQYDLGTLRSTIREQVLTRELFWLDKLQSETGLPSVRRMHAHGWVDQEDLLYAVVVERAEAALAPIFMTGALELRLPGSTKLIGARCAESILETLDNLHARYGLVIPSICLENVHVRSDWQSAFLPNLEL